MEQLDNLNTLEPLEHLEVSLNIKDTRTHYSNLDLVCISMNHLHESSLILMSIQVKRSNNQLTIQEYKKLNAEATAYTLKANVLLDMEKESFLFWNDEDIEIRYDELNESCNISLSQ